MPTPSSALPLVTVLVVGMTWLLIRGQATSDSHRRLAVALVVMSMLLPTFLFALGVIDLRTGTGVGLLVLAGGVVEAALTSRRGMQTYPLWPKRAWAALWLAVTVVHVLALLMGDSPYLPQVSLFAGLGVLWWVRIDRDLVERGIKPVWIAFAGLMLVLLPFGVLDGSNSSDPAQALDADSPYWNPILSAMGLDARWSGMFAHPNALGAFSAMGIGLALVGTRLSWPLIAVSMPLLLASSSRTAGIAALVGAVVYALVRGKLKSRLGVALAAVLVGWVTFQSLARDSNARTGTGRVEVWASVPRLLGPDWLWGLGPGAGARLVQAGQLPSFAAHLHSIVFEHLLFSGVLGLICVLGLILLLLALVLHERRGIPLLMVVLILALGDNYAHLYELNIGVVGYVTVIAVCTSALTQPSNSRVTSGRLGLEGASASGGQ